MRKRSVLLLLAAATLIIAGIARGETATVLNMVINLCLVCVGFG